MKEFLMAAALAATSFDVETTIRVQQRCATCYEANPFYALVCREPSDFISCGAGVYSLRRLCVVGTRENEKEKSLVGSFGGADGHARDCRNA